MRKKAIILDLDNTIYLVSSISDLLFKSLFRLITESGEYEGSLDEIKAEITRRPFQFVANDFSFSINLKSACLDLLNNLTFEGPIEPVENYEIIREFDCRKFLVTTGFTMLQRSKIKQLGIEDDFERIFIIDPDYSNLTKKDIFRSLLTDNNLEVEEVIVVGDDPKSEIQAAKDLGIESILYDYKKVRTKTEDQKIIQNFSELHQYI